MTVYVTLIVAVGANVALWLVLRAFAMRPVQRHELAALSEQVTVMQETSNRLTRGHDEVMLRMQTLNDEHTRAQANIAQEIANSEQARSNFMRSLGERKGVFLR